MRDLTDLLDQRPDLTLDELVATANELLPRYLPDDVQDARIKGEVNPRLVRHYTSQGLLEPPLRQGREARYTVDHLLQLLALRRLLADGVPAASIDGMLRQKDLDELRALLEGGARVEVAPAAPDFDPRAGALGFLGAVRERARAGEGERAEKGALRSAPSTPPPASPSTSAFAPPSSDAALRGAAWERFELLDGVELHVRGDVRVPSSPAAQRRLLDHITALLVQIAQRRMK